MTGDSLLLERSGGGDIQASVLRSRPDRINAVVAVFFAILVLGACPRNVAHQKSTSQNTLGSTIGSPTMDFLLPKSPIFGFLGQ